MTRLLCPWNSPGKNTGVGSHPLIQTQELNLGLLHCRQILYHLSDQGNSWRKEKDKRKWQDKRWNRKQNKWTTTTTKKTQIPGSLERPMKLINFFEWFRIKKCKQEYAMPQIRDVTWTQMQVGGFSSVTRDYCIQLHGGKFENLDIS